MKNDKKNTSQNTCGISPVGFIIIVTQKYFLLSMVGLGLRTHTTGRTGM